MVGKNNKQVYRERMGRKVTRYAIRRLTVGVASVAIGGLLFIPNVTPTQAAESDPAEVAENSSNSEGDSASAEIGGVQPSEGEEVEATQPPVSDVVEDQPEALDTEETLTEEASEDSEVQNNQQEEIRPQNELYAPAFTGNYFPVRLGNIPNAKDAIENSQVLPENTQFEWENLDAFGTLGRKPSQKIIVTYPDGTQDRVQVPVQVSNSYEIDGQEYSGAPASAISGQKEKAKTTINFSVEFSNITADSLNEDTLVFNTTAQLGSENVSGQNIDAAIEFDDRLARHIIDIRGTNADGFEIVWDRVSTSNGALTNTWVAPGFRAPVTWNSEASLHPGGAISSTTFSGPYVITFDKSINEILDQYQIARNGDVAIGSYMYFADTRQIIPATRQTSYLKVESTSEDLYPESDYSSEKNWFGSSAISYKLEPEAGENGAILFDHRFLKNSQSGGSLINYGGDINIEKPWAYHYEIDERLLPYIDSVDIYYVNNSGETLDSSYDPNQEQSVRFENETAPRKNQGWIDYEHRFNNGQEIQSEYTGEDGRLLDPRKYYDTTDEGVPDKEKYRYSDEVLKPGQGYFTVPAHLVNPNTRVVNFRASTPAPAALRVAVNLKPGVSFDDILAENRFENFGFNGYFVNSHEEVIPNTVATSSITVYDIDGDGVADVYEKEDLNITIDPIYETDVTVSGSVDSVAQPGDQVDIIKNEEVIGTGSINDDLSFLVNLDQAEPAGTELTVRVTTDEGEFTRSAIVLEIPDNERYEPREQNIETPQGVVPEAKSAITNTNELPDETVYSWEAPFDVDTPGERYTNVVVTYPDGTQDRSPVVVTVLKTPDNELYTPEVTPVRKEYGQAVTEEDIENAVSVPDYPEEAETYKVTVDEGQTLPDGSQAGQSDIQATVEYPDGTTDTVAVPVIIEEFDALSGSLTPAAQEVVEGNVIDPITVETNKDDATVTDTDLPNGLAFDPETNTISGVPTVDDWGDDETKDLIVTATISREGEDDVVVTSTITVQRDTDEDGNPDVTDKDDDGDGYSDEEEIERGSDPKDPNSIPAMVISPISGTEITNKDQTVVEHEPIEDVVITPSDEDAEITVGDLPDGITYDPDTRTLAGTPEVSDWDDQEEERELPVNVLTENPDGSKRQDTVTITVQRDTDGDGNPDVTDEDDDDDGIPDEVDDEPKVFTAVTGSISPESQSVIEGKAIEPITVQTNKDDATVEVTDLPSGLAFDPENNTISGVPTVDDWGDDEEKDLTVTATISRDGEDDVIVTSTITIQRHVVVEEGPEPGETVPSYDDLTEPGDDITDVVVDEGPEPGERTPSYDDLTKPGDDITDVVVDEGPEPGERTPSYDDLTEPGDDITDVVVDEGPKPGATVPSYDDLTKPGDDIIDVTDETRTGKVVVYVRDVNGRIHRADNTLIADTGIHVSHKSDDGKALEVENEVDNWFSFTDNTDSRYGHDYRYQIEAPEGYRVASDDITLTAPFATYAKQLKAGVGELQLIDGTQTYFIVLEHGKDEEGPESGETVPSYDDLTKLGDDITDVVVEEGPEPGATVPSYDDLTKPGDDITDVDVKDETRTGKVVVYVRDVNGRIHRADNTLIADTGIHVSHKSDDGKALEVENEVDNWFSFTDNTDSRYGNDYRYQIETPEGYRVASDDIMLTAPFATYAKQLKAGVGELQLAGGTQTYFIVLEHGKDEEGPEPGETVPSYDDLTKPGEDITDVVVDEGPEPGERTPSYDDLTKPSDDITDVVVEEGPEPGETTPSYDDETKSGDDVIDVKDETRTGKVVVYVRDVNGRIHRADNTLIADVDIHVSHKSDDEKALEVENEVDNWFSFTDNTDSRYGNDYRYQIETPEGYRVASDDITLTAPFATYAKQLKAGVGELQLADGTQTYFIVLEHGKDEEGPESGETVPSYDDLTQPGDDITDVVVEEGPEPGETTPSYDDETELGDDITDVVVDEGPEPGERTPSYDDLTEPGDDITDVVVDEGPEPGETTPSYDDLTKLGDDITDVVVDEGPEPGERTPSYDDLTELGDDITDVVVDEGPESGETVPSYDDLTKPGDDITDVVVDEGPEPGETVPSYDDLTKPGDDITDVVVEEGPEPGERTPSYDDLTKPGDDITDVVVEEGPEPGEKTPSYDDLTKPGDDITDVVVDEGPEPGERTPSYDDLTKPGDDITDVVVDEGPEPGERTPSYDDLTKLGDDITDVVVDEGPEPGETVPSYDDLTKPGANIIDVVVGDDDDDSDVTTPTEEDPVVDPSASTDFQSSSDDKEAHDTLPETGSAEFSIFGPAALSILAGLGMIGKKREDDE